MNVAAHMDHIAYPSLVAVTGIVATIGTASSAVVGMDTATQFAGEFRAFGPFAQLFVASLVMCVGGIVWWARMTERRLVAHRKRNDELLKELLDRARETERVANDKDEIIKRLVGKLGLAGDECRG